MSLRNVDMHRRMVEAFNAHDVEAFIAISDPAIEVHTPVTVPGGGAYHGHEGVRQWQRDLAEVWGSHLSVHVEAYFDLGDRTLIVHVLRARGRQSGADVELHAVQACTWRDGLMVQFWGYRTREEALRDIGVNLDELTPIAP